MCVMEASNVTERGVNSISHPNLSERRRQ